MKVMKLKMNCIKLKDMKIKFQREKLKKELKRDFKILRENLFYESSKQIYDFKIIKHQYLLVIVFITTKN